jgi:uncharacterized protein YqgC (DUF456 family)
MTVALLALALVAALLLVPLGLPGLWVMIGVALLYDLAVAGAPIGWWVLSGALLLATIAEVVEFVLGGRVARRFGGSRRAEWGAIIGGIAGAIIGVPVPIVGPMIGAFAGAFAGALAGELSVRRELGGSTRVAMGALVGRAMAVAVKVAIGCVIATMLLWAAWQ